MKNSLLKSIALGLFMAVALPTVSAAPPTQAESRTAITPFEWAVGLTILAFVGYVGCKGISWLLKQPFSIDNHHDYLNKKVTVGASTCTGREQAINTGRSRKIVLKVKNQFDSDGGGTASCGYHTVKNYIEIVNALHGNSADLQARLSNPQVIDFYFGPSGLWRAFMRDKEGRDGEWVQDIDAIFNFEKEQCTLAKAGVPYNLTVIDTIEVVGLKEELVVEHEDRSTRDEDEGLACPVMTAVRKPLRTKGDYVHGFAIQTGEQAEKNEELKSLSSRLGHWKILVLHKHKDGRRDYILCDSTNSSRLDDPYAQKIIDVIEELAVN